MGNLHDKSFDRTALNSLNFRVLLMGSFQRWFLATRKPCVPALLSAVKNPRLPVKPAKST
jgi:hypothetical protein